MSKSKKSQTEDASTKATNANVSRAPRPPAWRSRIGLIVSFFALTIGGAYFYQRINSKDDVKTYDFKVAAKYPHDSTAFTEGLFFHEGHIYESTGLMGSSTLRKFDLTTNQVTIEKIDPKIFGEGLVLWRDRLIQLTYDEGVAYCYDLDFKRLEQKFKYEGQGWGLTHDGKHLIMSNGTSELQFRNPETFELDHRLPVTLNGRRIGRLNELEYVNGNIYANIWHEDYILEIDPQSGQVTARFDLRGLLPRNDRPDNREAVLNGIAYNTETNRFIVTGKYWPNFFEIELVPRDQK